MVALLIFVYYLLRVFSPVGDFFFLPQLHFLGESGLLYRTPAAHETGSPSMVALVYFLFCLPTAPTLRGVSFPVSLPSDPPIPVQSCRGCFFFEGNSASFFLLVSGTLLGVHQHPPLLRSDVATGAFEYVFLTFKGDPSPSALFPPMRQVSSRFFDFWFGPFPLVSGSFC